MVCMVATVTGVQRQQGRISQGVSNSRRQRVVQDTQHSIRMLAGPSCTGALIPACAQARQLPSAASVAPDKLSECWKQK
jgi:succinyl-CoA synthetase alpha subunit